MFRENDRYGFSGHASNMAGIHETGEKSTEKD